MSASISVGELSGKFDDLRRLLVGLQEGVNSLLQAETVKEAYTTKELGKILKRDVYTVREWCRSGRMNARKTESGRGNEGEWRIPHAELIRYRNEGLLPQKPQAAMRY